MGAKNESPQRSDGRNPRDADTATYEQVQGKPEQGDAPNRQRAKVPHERDESASGAGNRLDQEIPPSGDKVSQAGKDVARGLVDTERRGIPNNVPKGKRDGER